MSTTIGRRDGLGIDLFHDSALASQDIVNGEPLSAFQPDSTKPSDVGDGPTSRSYPTVPSLRSMAAMEGLLLAEVGDGMVEFNAGSGFRAGTRIAPGAVTPGGGSKHKLSANYHLDQTSLSRHGTLLTVGGAPERNAAELKSLLGNASSRLKSGASVLPPAGGKKFWAEPVVLEQAKARARVEVDIALESRVCVQGGYLKGHVKIHVRKRSKKESPISLAEGKIRIVGFEFIPNGDCRYTFYHCAAPLPSIAASQTGVRGSSNDAEGFSEAREGAHIIPFALYLPLESESNAKGVLHSQSGVNIRYIAMASIKIKDSTSGHRSIAHFYRNCEVWPRLDPSAILAAAARPLLATTSGNIFMGGNGKVKLTASLHRLHWVAGQLCSVKLAVQNDTKKTVKSVTITLIRTTVVFRPQPHLGDAGDPDACQTSTTQKEVAETTLEIRQQNVKGRASAKGWWAGVGSGEEFSFSHFILLPPDALSVIRGRFLEVEYTLRISLGVGSLASGIHVVLPIRIINFLSIDPPPSAPLSSQEEYGARNSPPLNRFCTADSSTIRQRRQDTQLETFPSRGDDDSQVLDPPLEPDEIPSCSCQDCSETDEYPADDLASESGEELDPDVNHDRAIFLDRDRDSTDDILHDLHDLASYDDLDDTIQLAINSARINHVNPARFADLYSMSFQKDESEASGDESRLSPESTPRVRQSDGTVADPLLEIRIAGTPDTVDKQASSSFARRVREKLSENRKDETHWHFTSTLDSHGYVNTRKDLGMHSRLISEGETGSLDSGDMHSGRPRRSEDSCADRENIVANERELTCTNLATQSGVSDRECELKTSVSGMLSWLSTDSKERGDCQLQEIPGCQVKPVTASNLDISASIAASGTSSAGSRLLPKPPLVPLVVAVTSTPSSAAALPETRPPSSVNVEQVHTQQRMLVGAILGGSSGGAVKARIRELEDRAKVLSEM